MFQPNYEITNKIANDLVRIAELRLEILTSPITPKIEFKLQKEAILNNTHSSTSIEGNRLNLKQVEDLSLGRSVAATRKDENEVINYIAAMKRIPEYAKKEKIDEALILGIHHEITKGTLKSKLDEGVYRDRQVYIGKTIINGTTLKQEIVYTPPDAQEVPFLMDEFCEWINLKENKRVHPILEAGISHYEFVRIHPFIDGNGRTTRLLVAMLLYMKGFDPKRIFHLDDYYNRDRKGYYDALGSVDIETRNMTLWLEYFITGVRASLEELQIYMKETLGIIGKSYNREQVELTERQTEILKYLQKNKKITNKEVQTMFSVSHETAHNELMKLVNLNFLSQKGAGRGAFYELM